MLPWDSLLSAVQVGTEWAWDQIYRDLSPRVGGYLVSLGAADPDNVNYAVAQVEDAGFLVLPIHPVFVHFPVALLTIVWALTAWQYWRGTDRFEDSLRLAEMVGVAFLPIVVATGFLDADGFEVFSDRKWDQPLIWHVLIALVASVTFSAHLWWRRRTPERNPRTDVTFTTIGMWLLLMAALLAGEMVFA